VKRTLIPISMFLALVLGHAVAARAQADKSANDFQRMAAQLAGQREDAEIGQANDAATQALEEKALEALDVIALKALNVSGAPDLAALNANLASLVPHDSPDRGDYQVVRLPGASPIYAVIANFGLAGPSAVRLYAGSAGQLALAGRIDCYNPPKFFDEYLALLPIAASQTVFVTVAGRTDDLQTGIFTAWYFDGQTLRQAWASDLLQQSSYEADSSGFHLTYCAKPDDDHPGQCPSMVRDTFSWEDGAWKRRESTALGPAKAAQ
jgi:hypothetical protein